MSHTYDDDMMMMMMIDDDEHFFISHTYDMIMMSFFS